MALEGKDLVSQAVPVCPAALEDRESGREEGAWAAEAQVQEADARVEAPHRECGERARAEGGVDLSLC